MSFGIALAGGGARGAAHVGVLLALEEEGLYPDSIAGTSAGSLVAGLYASGITPKGLKEIVYEVSKHPGSLADPDVFGVICAIPKLVLKHSVNLQGILKGNRLEQYLYEKTEGKRVDSVKIRTIIPAVDINSGNTIAYTNSLKGLEFVERVKWKSDGLLSEAMRASSAFPAVFTPKWSNGMCLVDGGVTDVLPVDLLRAAGEKNVLAVDVAERYRAPKSMNLLEISSHCMSIMSTRLKECRSHGEKVLLVPSLPQKAGLLTLDLLPECMEAGYQAARTHMEFIREHIG